jgi:hypothetical protein
MSATTLDVKQRIDEANEKAAATTAAAVPFLVDVAPAGEVIDGLVGRTILHSGPPIGWHRMCGAQQGAVVGMVMFEGWASSPDTAYAMLDHGDIKLEPAHHHHAVGPMAGTISPSLPVWVVENSTHGNRACCRPAEERQQFGDYGPEAIKGLEQWRDVIAPTLRKAIGREGPINLKPIIIKALQMGDELHNRPNAASSLFARAIAPALVAANDDRGAVIATLQHLRYNDFLFLGISMASAKASIEPAEGIEFSTMVTAMARNGTEFGIRVAGLPGLWFTAPSPKVEGLLLPGYTENDAGLDMGDSAITETVGWGGFVIGGAPGILALTGGTPQEALGYTRAMRDITLMESPDYLMPAFGFEGAPVGIDIRKVVQTGTLPLIDTAMAHKEAGHPKIGAGLVRPPMQCFEDALRAFADRVHVR